MTYSDYLVKRNVNTCRSCIYPSIVLDLKENKQLIKCKMILENNDLSGYFIIESTYCCSCYNRKGQKHSCASGGSGTSSASIFANAHAPNITIKKTIDNIKKEGFLVGWSNEKY